jgi:hypothetical protein
LEKELEFNELEKKYFDLLSMFGLVLQSVGGSVEFTFEDATDFDPHGLELVQSFDPIRNVFRFEVRSAGR